MVIDYNNSIIKRADGSAIIFTRNGAQKVSTPGNPDFDEFNSFYGVIRNAPDRAAALQAALNAELYPAVLGPYGDSDKKVEPEPEPIPPKNDRGVLIDGLKKLMNFFTEFSFTPSFRFTNTLSYVAENKSAAKEYISNYFSLMDSSYTKEVSAKMNSREFDEILDKIAQYDAPASPINSRFKVYFGSAGTGKTTIAQTESENRCIVCNSSMLPADLMEDFIFKDGNPDFNPSLLWDCMEQGKTIVLDEINLLPFDSLRFLQGIVDGKSEFYYKNRPVHINDGFQIIGTMNLSLGGMVYGLPEPLVDRCCAIKEFKLTPSQLAKAIIGMGD